MRRILVPLDGSPLSENALPVALSVARRAKCELHLMLVHVPDTYSEYHFEDLETEAKQHERGYLEGLHRKLACIFTGEICIHHLDGIAPDTLAQEVAGRDIDLVVMNTHGWGYISRAIIGSVSDYLMRHLAVPILLMHSELALDRDVSFRRILVGLDGSDLAERILGPAQALGRLWNSDYHLLRVMSPPNHLFKPAWRESDASHNLLENAIAEAGKYLDLVGQRLGNAPSPVGTRVVTSASVALAILAEVDQANCDLIAIATHGRGGMSRLLLGSVADKVVRCGHRPVLVYRPTA